MPSSSWMDDLAELLKPEDPANVASMFAGARGSVPIYAGLYSKDASGPEELAFEARNRAASTAQRDAQYAAQMKAKGLAAIPEDALRKAVAARMQQEEQYPPALATRRADYAPQPRHEMRAFADGGGVHSDFTQPDFADGGALIPDREYAGGGGVRKTLQQMADEMLLRGVKTADKPDLARRSLFGLKAQPALDLPLARIEDIQKDVTKDMGKDLAKAPTVSEKSVEVNPVTGSVKSTLQSVANTPMSRRAVLQTAAGQVLRHAVPGLNEVVPTPDILGEIGKIADVVKPAQAATPAFTNPIAIIMHMRKNGATEEEIGKALGLTNPAELGPAPKPSAVLKSQAEIDAAKDFLFRNPEARAALEKASDGDIVKFAQLAQNRPQTLPPDWLLERFLQNGELEERMRTWLNTKGEYAALEKEMPKDFALPVDRNRARSEWQDFLTQYENVAEPAEYLRGAPPLLKTPSRALQEMTRLGTDTDAPLMSMRGDLRQLRAADPEQYETMKNAARDISMDSAEKAIELGLPKSEVQKVLSGQMSTDDLPRWYKSHREFDAPERDLFRLFDKE